MQIHCGSEGVSELFPLTKQFQMESETFFSGNVFVNSESDFVNNEKDKVIIRNFVVSFFCYFENGKGRLLL